MQNFKKPSKLSPQDTEYKRFVKFSEYVDTKVG
jgi:hypothetical protein